MVSGDGVQVEMPEFECGDVVRMISDMAEAYRLQQGHGEWNDDMALVCVHTLCVYTLLCMSHNIGFLHTFLFHYSPLTPMYIYTFRFCA